MTFHDLDRDVAIVGTGHDEDWDTKAWHIEDEDREARSWR
jgi:DNA-binding transcriptional regulator/RsmH inhibitor MraZ